MGMLWKNGKLQWNVGGKIAFVPTGGDPSDCDCCDVAPGPCYCAAPPDEVRVTLAGYTNNNCSSCDNINGEYVLSYDGTVDGYCYWLYGSLGVTIPPLKEVCQNPPDPTDAPDLTYIQLELSPAGNARVQVGGNPIGLFGVSQHWGNFDKAVTTDCASLAGTYTYDSATSYGISACNIPGTISVSL